MVDGVMLTIMESSCHHIAMSHFGFPAQSIKHRNPGLTGSGMTSGR